MVVRMEHKPIALIMIEGGGDDIEMSAVAGLADLIDLCVSYSQCSDDKDSNNYCSVPHHSPRNYYFDSGHFHLVEKAEGVVDDRLLSMDNQNLVDLTH